jgi:hypothetical protein
MVMDIKTPAIIIPYYTSFNKLWRQRESQAWMMISQNCLSNEESTSLPISPFLLLAKMKRVIFGVFFSIARIEEKH